MAISKEYSFMCEDVPPEIADKFNWGAFLCGWIWGFRYQLWFMLIEPILLLFIALIWGVELGIAVNNQEAIHLSAIPVCFLLLLFITFLPIRIFMGKVGNMVAWKYYTHYNVKDFNERQINWAILGVFVCLFSLPLFIPLAIKIFLVAMSNPEFVTMSVVTVIILNFFMYFVVKYLFKIYHISKNS